MVDPDEGLGEVFDLWSAATADELHRVLVLSPPVRSFADAFEPFALLSKHHESEPDLSPTTAMLLLTDPRWRPGVSHLIRRISDSGILDDEELDLLARVFLTADAQIYWEVPDEWFSDEGITLAGVEDEGQGTDEDRGPVLARRLVPPPLRRWAATREISQDPSTWQSVLGRARELDARHGAAVMAGAVDAVDVLPAQAQRHLIEVAATWPQQGVRRQALELILARDGAESAHRLGREDPNEKVRVWAAGLLSPSSTADNQEPPTLF